jgi:gamma-glutamyl:cysteine ligase YbdK (ATP-grasp superfamily)
MGQEIGHTVFNAADFRRFSASLGLETALLQEWFRGGRFGRCAYVAGFELEAWLLDHNLFPMPRNAEYLERLGDPLVVPELSRFNVELNGTPQPLAGQALRRIEQELTVTWRRCMQVAHELEGQLVMIGILPTVRQQDLTLANISALNRYYALNEQVLRLRGGRPIRLDVSGRERLQLTHDDVMLEAATTSFQVHLQAPADEAARYYNASLILSAPLVAMAANSPYLFGHDLWSETRVPLFEQAVDVGDDAHPERRRVTFGSAYLDADPLACYRENIEAFPVLLPIAFDDPPEQFRHLRLHNGTIWRWNRLLLGLDRALPQLRVEHRVMPAGPSIIDMIANAAVYLGAARFLAGLRAPPEADLTFDQARANFYAAARDGLEANLVWLDGAQVGTRALLLDEVLPMAREGLVVLGVDRDDIDRYLDVATARVRTGQTGSAWQRAHVERHGRDFFRLTATYVEQQRSGAPVHEWPV